MILAHVLVIAVAAMTCGVAIGLGEPLLAVSAALVAVGMSFQVFSRLRAGR